MEIVQTRARQAELEVEELQTCRSRVPSRVDPKVESVEVVGVGWTRWTHASLPERALSSIWFCLDRWNYLGFIWTVDTFAIELDLCEEKY